MGKGTAAHPRKQWMTRFGHREASHASLMARAPPIHLGRKGKPKKHLTKR